MDQVFRRGVVSLTLAFFVFAGSAFAQSGNFGTSAETKARLVPPGELTQDFDGIRVSPLKLGGGSTLTFVTPAKWEDLSTRLSVSLAKSHQQFSDWLGEIPSFKTSVRLMDEETFYAATGAPSWTNALYYRGQIIIPLPAEGQLDYINVERSITHEFTHAVINSLSKGRCPGWLDEGIAQWAEGDENPALQPALNGWVVKNGAVPLKLLQGGFTKLNAEMVAPAYAQSLFAATAMINSYGFKEIRHYFDELRDGTDQNSAFSRAFKLSEGAFEQRLGRSLKSWVKDKHAH